MRTPVITQILHDEVAEILTADVILDTSALAPLGAEGEGECAVHDGCRPID
ncbi:hypothetical protein [Pseudolysinimonas sp.]|jgi:hypothetical protein|uniref:hypothetical protein n=1 Tax=Pseudolysinimonas sp. TaxID=2680009 RepID=UPI0037844D40